MDTLFLVMPVYNESANLRQTVADWYPLTELGENSRLLLIDDGSKDDSLAILEELAKEYPAMLYQTKANSGHGPTIRYAYEQALELGADYIFQTDSDGQTRPEEFHDFWAAREQYQVQIGSRLKREDGFSRKLVSRILRLFVRIFFRVKTEDPNTPFRLFTKESLANFLPLVPKDFALTNVYLSAITAYSGVESRYLPITFLPRQGGKNSINLPRIARIAIVNLKQFPSLNRKMREEITPRRKGK